METKSREATQVSEPANETEMLYCIEHEQMVKAESGECGTGHLVIFNDGADFCCFENGFAVCPPPADLPDDWADQPDEGREEAELSETGNWLE